MLGLEEEGEGELEEEKLKEGEEFHAPGASCSTGSGRVGCVGVEKGAERGVGRKASHGAVGETVGACCNGAVHSARQQVVNSKKVLERSMETVIGCRHDDRDFLFSLTTPIILLLYSLDTAPTV